MTGGRVAPRLAMVVVVGLVWGIVLAGTTHAQDDPARLSERMCKEVSVSLPLTGDSHDDHFDDYA